MCSNPADRLQKTFWSFSATATTTILILAAVAGVRRRFTSAGGDRRPTMNNCACHRYEEILRQFLAALWCLLVDNHEPAIKVSWPLVTRWKFNGIFQAQNLGVPLLFEKAEIVSLNSSRCSCCD